MTPWRLADGRSPAQTAQKAEQLFFEGQFAMSLEVSTDSITRAKELGQAVDCSWLGLRAKCYARMGRWTDALVDVERALKNQPLVGNHFAARGIIYWKMGKHEAAFEDFRRARKLGVDGIADVMQMLRTTSARDAGGASALRAAYPSPGAKGVVRATSRDVQLAKLDSARRKLQQVIEDWAAPSAPVPSAVGGEVDPDLLAWARAMQGMEEELEKALLESRSADAQELVESIIAGLAVRNRLIHAQQRQGQAQPTAQMNAQMNAKSATRGLLHLRKMILADVAGESDSGGHTSDVDGLPSHPDHIARSLDMSFNQAAATRGARELAKGRGCEFSVEPPASLSNLTRGPSAAYPVDSVQAHAASSSPPSPQDAWPAAGAGPTAGAQTADSQTVSAIDDPPAAQGRPLEESTGSTDRASRRVSIGQLHTRSLLRPPTAARPRALPKSAGSSRSRRSQQKTDSFVQALAVQFRDRPSPGPSPLTSAEKAWLAQTRAAAASPHGNGNGNHEPGSNSSASGVSESGSAFERVMELTAQLEKMQTMLSHVPMSTAARSRLKLAMEAKEAELMAAVALMKSPPRQRQRQQQEEEEEQQEQQDQGEVTRRPKSAA